MYVIFPAEEVVNLTLGYVSNPQQLYCPKHQFALPLPPQEGPQGGGSQALPPPTKPNRKEKKGGKKKRNKKEKEPEQSDGKMATGGEVTLRDVTHPQLNESLKAHNSVTFKLVRTGE
ncbi:uncharacterized protein [Anabrus simplex]|uniref:uncharacterized protein n=1 Tax=Anabrus simplex TaxID=316456 RepID=UPI0035A318C8